MLIRSLAATTALLAGLGLATASADPATPAPEGPAPIDTPGPQEAAPPGGQVDPASVTLRVGFTPAMKEDIRTYYRGKGCPQGEPSPQAGCIPRTVEGKVPPYAIGRPLPDDLEISPLPEPLEKTLLAPEGYRFGLVGGDVLLVDEEDGRVADSFAAIDPEAP
jgi:hypothetical protein